MVRWPPVGSPSLHPCGVGADTIDQKRSSRTQTNTCSALTGRSCANTTFGVRYVYRNMPQVLEDIANCPMVAYELPQTSSICSSVEYILTNPTASIPVAPARSSSARLRRPGSQVHLTRVHIEPARVELVDDDVVSLLAAAR